MKIFIVIIFCFLILFGVVISLGDIGSRIDNWAHFGGFLGGFALYAVINKPFLGNDGACCDYKYWFYSTLGCLVIFLVTGFTCFYTLDKYNVSPIY